MDANFLYETNYFAAAIDYNYVGNYFLWVKSSYWPQNDNTTIFASPINGLDNNALNLSGQKSLINVSTISMTKYLAIDWTHNLAYFSACMRSKGIFVVNLTDPTFVFQVIQQLSCVTRDIRVDPIESIIVWSEYSHGLYSYRSSYGPDSDAKIKISSQDGSNIKLLVDSDIVWPQTLTLDIYEKRIYWIDTSLYTLSSVYYNGTNSMKIISSELLFEYTFAMDFYKDYIYWSSNKYDSILKTNKNGLNGTKLITVLQAAHDIDGFKILHNSSQPYARNKCIDANCSHLCLPSNGVNNFKCFCPIGYKLNGFICEISSPTGIKSTISGTSVNRKQTNTTGILENGSKLLYIAYKEGIFIKQNLNVSQTNYIESVELYETSGWLTEIDFNFYGNYMLWLEYKILEESSALYVAPIDKSKSNSLGIPSMKKLFERQFTSMRMSFDWIHSLIYVSSSKGIEVVSIDDNDYTYDVVVHNETQGDVAVDPIESVIVWSQWKYLEIPLFYSSYSTGGQYKGKIYKANQDGSNQVLLASDSIEIPFTLTIDLELKTIYWIDKSSHGLFSIDYNGNNKSNIVESKLLFGDIFSMDVFGDYIYWSNYERNAILKTNKYGLNKTERITVVHADNDLEGFKIIDSSRQPNATNKCLNANCSQLCLPLPNEKFRCLCSKYQTGYYYPKCIESITQVKDIVLKIQLKNRAYDCCHLLNSSEICGQCGNNDRPISCCRKILSNN
jgi:low density lipoprotein receptor-related protein 5/6